MIQQSAPGKLYIAGEYAVTEPGYPAVLVALNQYITVYLKQTTNGGSICSSHSKGMSIPWTRVNGQFVIDQRENPFAYVEEAIKITEDYVRELGYPLTFFDLQIESDLDNADGRKYGLGSSGAVTVATIKALLTFYKVNKEPLIVYKLAALAHLALNSNGSFGDLAASSFGGWVAYASFDKDWVNRQKNTLALTQLLHQDWPKLHIEVLTPPKDLRLMIGWTGAPASTTQLVDSVKDNMEKQNASYQRFLAQSYDCVHQCIEGFRHQNAEQIQAAIRKNRLLLQALGQNSQVLIETETLATLCDLAEKFGGAAKSSGAGGGDCGIALMNTTQSVAPLIEAWQAHQIEHLNLTVHQDNKH